MLSHLEVVGGRTESLALVCRSPDGTMHEVKTDIDTWNSFMGLLGYFDEDAEHCDKCGAMKTTRACEVADNHAKVFARACMCPAETPYLVRQWSGEFGDQKT